MTTRVSKGLYRSYFMFRTTLALAIASLFLTLSAGAQESCSGLDIQIIPQPERAFDTLTLKIEGAPAYRPTWIVGGISNQPQVIVYGPNLILNMDVSVPILRGYVGLTDDLGIFEQSYNVPRNVDLTLFVQAVTLDFEKRSGVLTFDFCTSDVVTMMF